jgi:hypothetical protein
VKAIRVTADELGRIVPDHVNVKLDHAKNVYIAKVNGVTYVAEFDIRTAVA